MKLIKPYCPETSNCLGNVCECTIIIIHMFSELMNHLGNYLLHLFCLKNNQRLWPSVYVIAFRRCTIILVSNLIIFS